MAINVIVQYNDRSLSPRQFTVVVDSRRGSTIGEGGDTTISSPGRSPKQPLPGMRLHDLHDPLHGRQACREFIAFDQGVGQICPRKGLFTCSSLPKRGKICYIPATPNR